MLRFAHQFSSASSRIAAKRERQFAINCSQTNLTAATLATVTPVATIATHAPNSAPLSKAMLSKLSAACQKKFATASAAAVSSASSSSPASSSPSSSPLHPRTPLPRQTRVIVPFMNAISHQQIHSRNMSTLAPAWSSHSVDGSWKVSLEDMHSTALDSSVRQPALLKNDSHHMGLCTFLSNAYASAGVSVGSVMALSYALVSSLKIPTLFSASVASSATVLGIPNVAAVLMSTASFVTLASGVWVGSLATLCGSIMILRRSQPTTIRDEDGSISTVNSWLRRAAFSTMIASSAVVATPMMYAALASAPWFVPTAAVGIAGSLAASMWYTRHQVKMSTSALWSPSPFLTKIRSNLVRWQSPLIGTIGGFSSLLLVGSSSILFLGPNSFSLALLTPQPFIVMSMIGLCHLADTYECVNEYKKGEADHMIHSIRFFSNGYNFLLASIRQLLKTPLI